MEDALEPKITTKNPYFHVKFLDCAVYMSKLFNQNDFELCVTLCWAIWWESCKRKHDNDGMISNLCVDWAFAFFDVVHASSSKRVLPGDTRQMKAAISWIPPAPNLFRLDVDAGFDIMRNKFSVGAIIRDSEGLIRGAHALNIRNPGSVLAAELLAIRYGMDLCLHVGFSGVYLLRLERGGASSTQSHFRIWSVEYLL